MKANVTVGFTEDVLVCLQTSTEPCRIATNRLFVFAVLASSLFKQQITELSATVVALKEELKDALKFRETCSALAGEVATLRQALDSLEKEVKSSSQLRHPNHGKQTYAAALKAPSTGSRRPAPTRSTTAPSSGAQREQKAQGESSKSKVKVDGARRVWGTMRACSPGAILATISRLVPVRLELRIKRKTKLLASGKTVWWYVIHGTESDLVLLEQGWEKIQNQTSWTLQHCLMSSTTPNTSSEISPPNVHASIPPTTEGHSKTATEAVTDGGLGDHQDLSHPATCLLYTSPSPRDATLSRMPSSA